MLKKLRVTISAQLSQGMTPGGAALSLVVGAAIAVFPVLGLTTSLGLVVAHRFRLSHVLVQALNFLLYPAQIALLPVFMLIGQWVLGMEQVALSPREILERWTSLPFLEFLAQYGKLGLAAVFAWALIIPPIAWIAKKGVLKWVSKLPS